ncbi:MAG: glycoside hydrolase family 130 protein [Spirochaetales bacterium]|nr:glycoside hydrolase family 130 protein [Spirochaetales bacterium]
MSLITRCKENPLIRPADILPSAEGYQVLGSFNPAATEFEGEIILLLRVAENCIREEGYVSVPYYHIDGPESHPAILRLRENDPEMELKDTRGVLYRGVDYLSTMSHLRLARSRDGIHFKVDDKPFIYPTRESEAFGVEDARITKIKDRYWINYTGVSKDGFCTMLAVTDDFVHVEKKGIIFPPMNKDVALFNEPCGGYYYCLHRPNNQGFGKSSIWIGRSPDLLYWGDHKCLLRPDDSVWEREKIGGGAPPYKTEEGWLTIYHSKGENQRYTLNTLLLDLEHPDKIIAKGSTPLLEPEEIYETDGFFGNVVFTNGMVVREEEGEQVAWIYYGASDDTACLFKANISDLIAHARG